MSPSRGRLAALGMGVLALSIPVFVALEWRRLVVHYRSWRLDHARSKEKAEPWLTVLARDAGDPRIARLLVGKLGEDRPYLTFWILSGWASRASTGNPSFLREFGHRLESDAGFLRLWTHHLRWSKNWLLVSCVNELHDPLGQVSELDVFAGKPVPYRPTGQNLRQPPTEAQLQLTRLEQLGAAWFLGTFPAPLRPADEPDDPVEEIHRLDVSFARRFIAWLNAHHSSLRFDPDEGRCVLIEKGASSSLPSVGERLIPPPEIPLPRWQGPVPSL